MSETTLEAQARRELRGLVCAFEVPVACGRWQYRFDPEPEPKCEPCRAVRRALAAARTEGARQALEALIAEAEADGQAPEIIDWLRERAQTEGLPASRPTKNEPGRESLLRTDGTLTEDTPIAVLFGNTKFGEIRYEWTPSGSTLIFAADRPGQSFAINIEFLRDIVRIADAEARAQTEGRTQP